MPELEAYFNEFITGLRAPYAVQWEHDGPARKHQAFELLAALYDRTMVAIAMKKAS